MTLHAFSHVLVLPLDTAKLLWRLDICELMEGIADAILIDSTSIQRLENDFDLHGALSLEQGVLLLLGCQNMGMPIDDHPLLLILPHGSCAQPNRVWRASIILTTDDPASASTS